MHTRYHANGPGKQFYIQQCGRGLGYYIFLILKWFFHCPSSWAKNLVELAQQLDNTFKPNSAIKLMTCRLFFVCQILPWQAKICQNLHSKYVRWRNISIISQRAYPHCSLSTITLCWISGTRGDWTKPQMENVNVCPCVGNGTWLRAESPLTLYKIYLQPCKSPQLAPSLVWTKHFWQVFLTHNTL